MKTSFKGQQKYLAETWKSKGDYISLQHLRKDLSVLPLILIKKPHPITVSLDLYDRQFKASGMDFYLDFQPWNKLSPLYRDKL